MTQLQPLPAAATADPTPGGARDRRQDPGCAGCYFGLRGLCALELEGPCATFRLDSPEGPLPPAQPTLLVGAGPAASPSPTPAVPADPQLELPLAAAA